MPRYPLIEPPPTEVVFPPGDAANEDGVVAYGSDFRPGTLLAAYRRGIFPWPHGVRGGLRHRVFWFSPDPRALFPLDAPPHWSRSLRRTLRQHPYRISFDEAFEQVVRRCGETRPEGTWIIEPLIQGYVQLHRLGFAHSVEVWDGDELIGGLYGVAIGGAFAGESMFHSRTDASKIAFSRMVERLRAQQFALFDVQVQNPHLLSLGCVEWSRARFLPALAQAQQLPCHFHPPPHASAHGLSEPSPR